MNEEIPVGKMEDEGQWHILDHPETGEPTMWARMVNGEMEEVAYDPENPNPPKE